MTKPYLVAFTCHLGSEQTIEDTNANRFSDALCELVATPCDSAQNGAWPLIKKVQLFCNAQILATGAVLVDLPGVNDSNKARNRVAKDYMDQCENYWLVAPVDRILDSDTMKGKPVGLWTHVILDTSFWLI